MCLPACSDRSIRDRGPALNPGQERAGLRAPRRLFRPCVGPDGIAIFPSPTVTLLLRHLWLPSVSPEHALHSAAADHTSGRRTTHQRQRTGSPTVQPPEILVSDASHGPWDDLFPLRPIHSHVVGMVRSPPPSIFLTFPRALRPGKASPGVGRFECPRRPIAGAGSPAEDLYMCPAGDACFYPPSRPSRAEMHHPRDTHGTIRCTPPPPSPPRDMEALMGARR